MQVGLDSIYMLSETSYPTSTIKGLIKYTDFDKGVVSKLMAEDISKKSAFALVNYNDKYLFTIGGRPRVAKNAEVLSSVEKYNIETDTWSIAPPLIEGRKLASSCILNGHIYVYGGERADASFLSSVEVINAQAAIREDFDEEFLLNARWETIELSVPGRARCVFAPINGSQIAILGGIARLKVLSDGYIF